MIMRTGDPDLDSPGQPAACSKCGMSIAAFGLNHQTAPLMLREQLAFQGRALLETAGILKERCGLSECAIVSTCNRAEFYAVGETCSPADLMGALSDLRQASLSELRSHSYEMTGSDVVRHLCRVASGLDSMVMGEGQVLGQVKQAAEDAVTAGTSGPILAALFRQAITAGKRARTETEIGRGAVSISHAAVELARQVFGDLTGCRALVLGAGEMSEITLKLLKNAGLKTSVMISNRTRERAEALAQRCGGVGVDWERFPKMLPEADIVIVSTSAPHFVVKMDLMRQAMKARRGRHIFLIDISVPRNVDPAVGTLDDVFLFNVDDLQGVVSRNLGDRQLEADKVELIVASETARFEEWFKGLGVVPAIVGLRRHAERVRQEEWDRFAGRLAHLGEKDLRVVDALTRQIANRMLHQPLAQLKELGVNGNGYDRVQVIRELFALNGMNEPIADEPESTSKQAVSVGCDAGGGDG